MPPPSSPQALTFMASPNASTSLPVTYHQKSNLPIFPTTTPTTRVSFAASTPEKTPASPSATPIYAKTSEHHPSNRKHPESDSEIEEVNIVSQSLLQSSSSPTHRAPSHALSVSTPPARPSLPLPSTPMSAIQLSPVSYQLLSPSHEQQHPLPSISTPSASTHESLFTPPPTQYTRSVSPMTSHTHVDSGSPTFLQQSHTDQPQSSSDISVTHTSKKRKTLVAAFVRVPPFPIDITKASYFVPLEISEEKWARMTAREFSRMTRDTEDDSDDDSESDPILLSPPKKRAAIRSAVAARSVSSNHSRSPKTLGSPAPSSSSSSKLSRKSIPKKAVYNSVEDALNSAFGGNTVDDDDVDYDDVSSVRKRGASEDGGKKGKVPRRRPGPLSLPASKSDLTSGSEMVSSGRPKRDSGLSRGRGTPSSVEERPTKKPRRSTAVSSGLPGVVKPGKRPYTKGAQKKKLPEVDSNGLYSYGAEDNLVMLYVDVPFPETRRRGFLGSRVFDCRDREQEELEDGILAYSAKIVVSAAPRAQNKQREQLNMVGRIPKRLSAVAQPGSSSDALVGDERPAPQHTQSPAQTSVPTSLTPEALELPPMSAKARGKQRAVSPEYEGWSLFGGEKDMDISDIDVSLSVFEETAPLDYEGLATDEANPSRFIHEDDLSMSCYIRFDEDSSPTSSVVIKTPPRPLPSFAGLNPVPGSDDVPADFNFPSSSSHLNESLFSPQTLRGVPGELDVASDETWLRESLDSGSGSLDPFFKEITDGTINPTALLPEYDPVLSRDYEPLHAVTASFGLDQHDHDYLGDYDQDEGKEEDIVPSPSSFHSPLLSQPSSAPSNTYTASFPNSTVSYFEGNKLPPRSTARFISVQSLSASTAKPTATSLSERISASTSVPSALANLLGYGSSEDENDENDKDYGTMAAEPNTNTKNSDPEDGNGIGPDRPIVVGADVDADADASADELGSAMIVDDVDWRDAVVERTEHGDEPVKRPDANDKDDPDENGPDSDSRPPQEDKPSQQASSSTMIPQQKSFHRGGQGVDWPTSSDEYYCHHCRTKPFKPSMACSSCPKKYCIKCIVHRYGDLVTFDDGLSNWKCFMCQDNCKCDKCSQRRDETYIRLPFPVSLPAVIIGEIVAKERVPAPIVVSGTINEPFQPWGVIYDFSGQKIAQAFVIDDDENVFAQPLPKPANSLPPSRRVKVVKKKRSKFFVGSVQPSWRLTKDCLVKSRNDADSFPSSSTSTPQDDNHSGAESGIKRRTSYVGRTPPKKIIPLPSEGGDGDESDANANLFGDSLDDMATGVQAVPEDADDDMDAGQQRGLSPQLFVEVNTPTTVNDLSGQSHMDADPVGGGGWFDDDDSTLTDLEDDDREPVGELKRSSIRRGVRANMPMQNNSRCDPGGHVPPLMTKFDSLFGMTLHQQQYRFTNNNNDVPLPTSEIIRMALAAIGVQAVMEL
ncbi:hypothetical protein D9758_000882 [Tetrapyrgos nigripes]|uniref:Zinc-finger domain-containing protein n=1 Tax=Tetrapyrgos nigripes TaxID=182062 RepID=A0A8H5GYZ4_9AGAR|nr:hypothetical protein D9758_000882 [Tetrapyrgos nigripes]